MTGKPPRVVLPEDGWAVIIGLILIRFSAIGWLGEKGLNTKS